MTHQIQVPYFQGPMYHVALVLEVSAEGSSFVVFDATQPLTASPKYVENDLDFGL